MMNDLDFRIDVPMLSDKVKPGIRVRDLGKLKGARCQHSRAYRNRFFLLITDYSLFETIGCG
jgi:hypothetical protein